LAEAGHRVALTARNAAELDETAALCKSPTLVVPAELTEPAAVPSKPYPRMDTHKVL
jgi:hypothetical protein